MVGLVPTVISSWFTRVATWSFRWLVKKVFNLIDSALYVRITWRVFQIERLLVWMRVRMIKCNLASLDKSAVFGLPSTALIVLFIFRQLWVNSFGASDSVGNLHLLGLCIAWVSLFFIILIFLESGSLWLSLNFPVNWDRFGFLIIIRVQTFSCNLGPWYFQKLIFICCKFSNFILDQALLRFVSP